jgi:hypothetical protein
MTQTIYLLKLGSSENLYKLGRSEQFMKRFATYRNTCPTIIAVLKCDDCCTAERELLSVFRSTFKERQDIGVEYFEGDERQMMQILHTYFIDPENSVHLNGLNIIKTVSKNSNLRNDNSYTSTAECTDDHITTETNNSSSHTHTHTHSHTHTRTCRRKYPSPQNSGSENIKHKINDFVCTSKIVLYECPRCKYSTDRKDHMVRHLNRTKICPSVKGDIELTNEVKEIVLLKRIYHPPKVVEQPVTYNHYNHCNNTYNAC